jgi:hypothetical protein
MRQNEIDKPAQIVASELTADEMHVIAAYNGSIQRKEKDNQPRIASGHTRS